MAILLAGYHPSVRLLGISTVASNQVVEKTTANALAILDWIGLKDVGGWGTAVSSAQLRPSQQSVDPRGLSTCHPPPERLLCLPLQMWSRASLGR